MRLKEQIISLLKRKAFSNLSLRPLMRQHQDLQELCCVRNDACGFPMLLAFTSLFLGAIFCISYAVNLRQVKLDHALPLLWALWQNIPVGIPIKFCQESETEARI